MAYDEPGALSPPRPKRRPKVRFPGFPGDLPDVGAFPTPPAAYNPPPPDWRGLIETDPMYQQGLRDLLGLSTTDKTNTLSGLRSALVKYGGGGLKDLAGKLGPGWEDLLDPQTLGAAAAGDTAGTSLAAQLDKTHADRNLALQDVLAAKGILSSGQSGYELGEERQRDTIARNDAVTGLLEFLQGLTGGYATREGERNVAKSNLGATTLDRLLQMGLEPAAPRTPDFAGIWRGLNHKRTPRRDSGLRE